MNTKNCKEELINITTELINENNGDVDKVTIRDITSRSGVSVGLINYHFGSKDNLIAECVQRIITGIITSFKPNIEVGKDLSPLEAAKARTIDTACRVFDYLFENPSISRVSITSDCNNFTSNTNTYYSIRGSAAVMGKNYKDEATREFIAFTLVSTMQSAFLRALKESVFMGYDFSKKEDRNRYVVDLVNQVMKEQCMTRFKVFRVLLLIFCFFIGLGALYGGISMLIKPDGSLLRMEQMLPYFQVLPFADILFQNYIFPGIALIIVNGITNLTAAILVLCKKRIGYVLGTIFGFTLMLWIIIQFVIFPANVLSTTYFILGVLQLICGYVALVSFNQVNFKFSEDGYQYIDKNSKTLVVYFSRMQFTKRIAYVKANKEHANIVELKTKERTEGTLGFWWCGRFGMHKWPMETYPLDIDLNNYDKLILVTPVWVFKMCSPMRDFITKNKEILKNKEIEVIFNHFNPWLPKGAIKEIERDINISKVESKTTWLGHTFKLEKQPFSASYRHMCAKCLHYCAH